jgi:hypothetical protein
VTEPDGWGVSCQHCEADVRITPIPDAPGAFRVAIAHTRDCPAAELRRREARELHRRKDRREGRA